MIRSKKLVDVIRPLSEEMSLSDELYGHILGRYSACKFSAKVKTLDYPELCKLANNFNYTTTIIQNEKIFDNYRNNCFCGHYEDISACYQINPFSKAIVIVQNRSKYNSCKIFCYEPYAFDEIIILPNISCLKYLFEYFNVSKSNGALATNLDELSGETEVIAISKQTLTYNSYERSYTIHIILRWYEGYF